MSKSNDEIASARKRLMLRAEKAFSGGAIRTKRVASSVLPAPQTNSAAPVPVPVLKTVRPDPIPARSAPVLLDTPTITVPQKKPTKVVELPPFTSPVLSTLEKAGRLRLLDETQVKGCTKCRLSAARTNTVFGETNVDAEIFFIGEGPGQNEDETGRPFVGRAGEQLNKQIAAMGLRREDVYIANIVKCRPPENRAPLADETHACTPYLLEQLETVRPKVIITLGLPATNFMLQSKKPLKQVRGIWQTWRGIDLMPTFHPAYVLRYYTHETRAAVWGDLKQVLEKLGRAVPKRGGE